MSKLTSDLWMSKDVLVFKVWSLSSKGFSRYWVVNIFICQIWPLDLLTLKYVTVVYFPWYTCLQSLKSVKQTVLKILSGQYIPMSSLTPWPLTSWPKNQSWSSTFHDVLVYKVWSLSSKGFSRYGVVSIFLCPIWPLDLWPIDLKINRGHLLFRMYECIKFEVCQAKG